MSSFLDKLKKGMDIDEENIKEIMEEDSSKKLEETPEKPSAPSTILTSAKTLKKKSVKKKNKKEKKSKKSETKKEEKKTIKVHPVKSARGGARPVKSSEASAKQFNRVKKEKSKKETSKKENSDKGWFEPEGQLTIDVYETDKDIVIQSAIAGIKPEDLDITFENDMVIIKGKRERETQEEIRNYFYQECYWGYFSREIVLPKEVDSSKAKATMKEGILTITIPKIERKNKRKILVESKDEE